MVKWTFEKQNYISVIVLLLIAFFLNGKLSAQSQAGRTTADFLSIGIGAKSAGMSGAYTAVSGGADAAYWNPAGLTSVESSEILLGHFNWYQDVALEHGGFAKKINENSAFAVSITYLNYGTIKRYGLNGEPLANDISVYDWSGAVSYGYEVSDNMSIGFTAKYVNQTIDDLSGSAFAGDIGFKYIAPKFAIAGFMGNFGTKMKFNSVEEKLPATARLGLSFYPFSQSFVTAIEAEKKLDGNTVIRHGVEYNFNEQYYIRSGYNYFMDETDRSFGSNLSFGAGLEFNSAALDYAFTTSDSFTGESLHRFSLLFKFGK